MRTEAVDADAMYDEIGGALRIKQLQQEKRELLESLELYYRVFVLGEEIPEEEGENANSSAGAPENMEDTDGESSV